MNDRKLLAAAVRAQFPRCPGFFVDEIVLRLATQNLLPALLPRAVAAMAEDVVRHQLTDYDQLTKAHGLQPDEARQAVAAEIADILADWRYK